MTSVAGVISDTFSEGAISAHLVWIAARSVKQPGGHALVYDSPDGDVYRSAAAAAYGPSQGETGEHGHELGALPAGTVVTLTPRFVVTVKFTRSSSHGQVHAVGSTGAS